jgi:hypothetical protein
MTKPNKERGGDWILLIHQLPAHPTNLRVRIWRKLQQLGAVAIKNSVYVLPVIEQTQEDFQWLKQEIESAGGEAAVFRAGSVEGATDEEIVAAFRKVRDEEFTALSAEFDGLTGMRESSTTSAWNAMSRLLRRQCSCSALARNYGRSFCQSISKHWGPAHRSFQSILKRVPIVIAPVVGGVLIASLGLIKGIHASLLITLLLTIVTLQLVLKINVTITSAGN